MLENLLPTRQDNSKIFIYIHFFFRESLISPAQSTTVSAENEFLGTFAGVIVGETMEQRMLSRAKRSPREFM